METFSMVTSEISSDFLCLRLQRLRTSSETVSRAVCGRGTATYTPNATTQHLHGPAQWSGKSAPAHCCDTLTVLTACNVSLHLQALASGVNNGPHSTKSCPTASMVQVRLANYPLKSLLTFGLKGPIQVYFNTVNCRIEKEIEMALYFTQTSHYCNASAL